MNSAQSLLDDGAGAHASNSRWVHSFHLLAGLRYATADEVEERIVDDHVEGSSHNLAEGRPCHYGGWFSVV